MVRNPDGNDGAWCYTMDSWLRTSLCDIPQCPVQYDYHCQSITDDKGDGAGRQTLFPYDDSERKRFKNSYRGMADVSVSGKTCVNWQDPRLEGELKASVLLVNTFS